MPCTHSPRPSLPAPPRAAVRWFSELLNKLQDDAMFALIGRKIIYNVAWEDPRIDAELLDIGPTDTMLMLTTGGCNVLDMLLEGPAKIVAADLNPRQNALLELKVVCIQELEHEQFFQLFAKSNEALFRELYPRLRVKLSEPAREFWDENAHFFKSVFWSGASGFAAYLMLNIAKALGVGGLIRGGWECNDPVSVGWGGGALGLDGDGACSGVSAVPGGHLLGKRAYNLFFPLPPPEHPTPPQTCATASRWTSSAACTPSTPRASRRCPTC